MDKQKIVATIALTFLIFSLSFFLTLFDKTLYNKVFIEHGVYDELGVEGVRSTVDYLIKYLTSEGVGQEGLSLFFPNEREHLKDVKRLVLITKYLTILCIAMLSVIIYYSKDRARLLRFALPYSAISAIALVALLALLSINFSSFWEGFHKVLFPQGNYAFPADHLLIKLFPEEFFKAFTTRTFTHIGVLCIAMLGTAFALSKRNARGDDVRNP